jgi:uncharacterized membrane protein YciS (DUF1049 family)
MAAIADSPTSRKPRWYVPTPVKFLLAVLMMQGVLFLSSHCGWFWFNDWKGYTVLITVAATAVALVVLAAAVMVSWFFKARSQFSLATLLLIVSVMGISCGWLGRTIGAAREQRAAVESLRTARADVKYHDRRIDTSKAARVLLPILEQHLGQDFFADVSYVSSLPATDDDLENVRGFTRLDALSLSNAKVTDEGLKHLRGLTELRGLFIQEAVGTKVPGFTDVGMLNLKNLRKLESLRISGHGVTDKGLAQLKAFSNLKRLTLLSSNMTDSGLSNIADLQQLTVLELHGDKITGAGLVNVKRLTQLRELTLSSTSIADSGLVPLQGLTQLERITLLDTTVSDEGVNRVQNALPRSQIIVRGLGRFSRE